MNFLDRFKKQTSPADDAPDPYADDIIYPVYILDDTKTFRSILITWTLVFNDVLNADKLRSSLANLLETGDWRKLGGRLRLKVSNFNSLCFHCTRANRLTIRN